MWLFLLLAGIFVLWILQNMLFQKYWKRGLSVSLHFQDPYIFEGETSAVKEIVTNDKLLPLAAVSVRISMNRNLSFLSDASENSDVSDQTYKRDIFSLLFHQQITRTLPLLGKKRGFYRIGEADVTAYDFFFQQSYYTHFPQDTHLFVYPKPVDIRRIRLISQAISGSILTRNRLHPDPFEFCGIREYRHEDPMNRINWKASARTGELMVNQFDSTTDYSITIFLDLEDPYILKYEPLTEESVRIAASLAAYLIRHRMPVRLVSNGDDLLPHGAGNSAGIDTSAADACAAPVAGASVQPAAGIDLSFPAGSGKLSQLYETLACVDSSRITCRMEELLLQREFSLATGETYVVISKNHAGMLPASIRRLMQSQNDVLWLMPVLPAAERPSFDKIPVFYWEVEQ
jgi:hypothetical protein